MGVWTGLQVGAVVVHSSQVQVLWLFVLRRPAVRLHPSLARGQSRPLLRALEPLVQTRADHLCQVLLQTLEVLPAGEG